jgi:predicted dehydrogenase
MPRLRKRSTVVFEGVGDAIDRLYLPALRKLAADGSLKDIDLIFADRSSFWRDNPPHAARVRQIIDALQALGAVYLDKDDRNDRKRYEQLNPKSVLIVTPDVTHVQIATDWLSRPMRAQPQQIVIEKPLTNSVPAARDLLGKLGERDGVVFAFDHYMQRIALSDWQDITLQEFVVTDLKEFRFYFLEDHSAGHADYEPAARVGRDGAIENEQREKTLNEGVILDMMPHVLAVASTFGMIATVQVTKVTCGQYVGVDGDPKRPTEIDRETYAEIHFRFNVWPLASSPDLVGHRVGAVAYVGKGVRGVREFSREGNVKCLQLIGSRGQIATFDFARDPNVTTCVLTRGSHEEAILQIIGNPHEKFLRDLFTGKHENRGMLDLGLGRSTESRPLLDVGTAKRLLEVIDDMRHPVPIKNKIQKYKGGMRHPNRKAPYLEDITRELTPVYGV